MPNDNITKKIEDFILAFDASGGNKLLFYYLNFFDICFEERVKIKCFHCKRYNKKWTCPPKMPDLDYKKIISEYSNIVAVVCKYYINKETFEEDRNKSTNILHKLLLQSEKILWENNYPMAISFIGGSCKLCENGCDEHSCRNPHLARIPIEATGINVINTMKKYIDISFPPKEYIYRVGLLLW